MYTPRIIPVLLLQGNSLVKSVRFKKHKYIGDPINAVRIFNDLTVDEIVFLDISASKENRLISMDFIKDVGEEANMPFAVGGGVKTLEDIEQIIKSGAERVIINTAAVTDPNFIKSACDKFGSSTIIVCIDVKKRKFKKGNYVYLLSGSKSINETPENFAIQMEELGVGEIIIQSIDKDGLMNGYDLELIRSISEKVKIPVIALGGAGVPEHLEQGFNIGLANGLAAGSLFVYHDNNRGVLINYVDKSELNFIR